MVHSGMANGATVLSLYCPLTLYFFHKQTIQDVSSIEDSTDFYGAEVENGHEVWLDDIKKILPDAMRLLPKSEVYGEQYRDIKARLVGCNLDVEIVNGVAFLVMHYGLVEAVDLKLLKEYCTQQFLGLGVSLSDQTTRTVEDGVLCIGISPVPDFCNDVPYESNVAANGILLKTELP